MAADIVIRPRLGRDLSALVRLMGEQQPTSRYPLVWPLPEPPEQFIVRPSEQAAWVAESGGQIVGHVCVTTVPDDDIHSIWSRATGLPHTELGCVSVLFVGADALGTGAGGRLLDTAVAAIRARGQTPVLEVTTQESNPAARVYQHRGWQLVGHSRPAWLPDEEPDVQFFVLPDDVGRVRLSGTTVHGHQVASGRSAQSPHPAGTIALQQRHFAARGFDLDGLERATVNLALDDVRTVEVVRPTFTLTNVAWTDLHAAEDFSFVACRVHRSGRAEAGYVYWPHPETKPANFQPGNVIELLLPRIDGLDYGDRLDVELPERALLLV